MNFSNKTALVNSNKLSPWWIFAATTMGAMMVNIDASIVNVALPTIATVYAEKISKVQWIISSYIMVICILLPICGRLSDIYTKRFIYLLGFAIFTVGSALCSIANSLLALIVFRLIQGIGSAMIMSNNQAIIVENFPRELQGRALGINSMSASFGVIVGPALGGFLLSFLSWRSIFYVNIPIGIIGCLAGYYVLPRHEKRVTHPFDIIGSVLFAMLIICILLLLGNVSSWGWLAIKNLLLLIIFVIAGWFFIKHIRRTSHPVLDLSLFKVTTYLHGNTAAFIVFMVMGGNSVLLPFYLHDILKFTPGLIGWLMFIGPSIMLILAPITGYLFDKFPSRALIIVGLVLIMAGMFLQGSATVHSTIWDISMCQILIGCGFAFFQVPNNTSLFKNIVTAKLSIASSTNALMRSMGRVFGVVVATSIFALLSEYVIKMQYVTPHSEEFFWGFRAAYYSLTAVMFISLYNAVRGQKVENGGQRT